MHFGFCTYLFLCTISFSVHSDLFICTISDLLAASDEASRQYGPFVPLPTSATLLDAMLLLSRHLHRVPVVESGGDISNLITQSALLKFVVCYPSLHHTRSHTIPFFLLSFFSFYSHIAG
jgi:hypothetical protein